jgi:excisionase family DNA binding protein
MAGKNLTDTGSQRVHGIGNPTFRRLLTLKEAAAYLGRSPWSMRDLVWSGRIPVVRNEGGRKLFFDIRDLDVFIERNKVVYE